MSILPWVKRKTRINLLLKHQGGDEDAASLALDQILHGQSVIGRTCLYSLIVHLEYSLLKYL